MSTLGLVNFLASSAIAFGVLLSSQIVKAQTLLQQQGTLERGDRVLRSDGSLYDEYTFVGRTGQQIRITLESANFDTYLILLNPNRNDIGQNDDANDNTLNSELTLTLPVDGTYTVVVNGLDENSLGEYNLTVETSTSSVGSVENRRNLSAEGLQSCQSTVRTVENRLEEVGDLQVEIHNGEVGYPDRPTDRPEGYVFAMTGSALESVMRSPVLLTELSANIIQSCDSVGMVTFGLANSGYVITFGLFPNGEVEPFRCVDRPDRRNIPRLRWGTYDCSI